MKVHRPELKWYEESYLWGILKGMWQTLRHLFRRKRFTVEYPEVRWPLPPGYRGAPVLVTGDDGHERCVACLMCMFVCPPQAIYIEAEETSLDKERRPRIFDIDFGRCIFCGYCEEACPEIAIVLKDEFELASFTREGLIKGRDQLLEMGLKERTSFVYPVVERGPEPPRPPLTDTCPAGHHGHGTDSPKAAGGGDRGRAVPPEAGGPAGPPMVATRTEP